MERLAKTALFDHIRRVGSAHWHTDSFSSHFSANAPFDRNGLPCFLPEAPLRGQGQRHGGCKYLHPGSRGRRRQHGRRKKRSDDCSRNRPYCYGGAVQQGKFRPVSGFLNGFREGYKAVTALGYDGQLTAFGPFVADTTSKAFDAFRKFTKQNENREKAQITAEAVPVALGLAANGEDGFKKGSFSMHPKLHARSLEYLSSFQGGMEDPNAVQQMLLKVLVIKDKHYGEQSLEVAETLNVLAIAYRKLGDFRTQKDLLERALKIQESQYLSHEMGVTLNNLGNAYSCLEDYGKAKEVYERVLKIKEQTFGKRHFEVAATLNNLGKTHRELKDYEKSKEVLERALEVKEQHYGKSHFEVANTLLILALTHGCLGDQKRKVELLKTVLPIYQNHYGVHSDQYAKVRRALAEATRLK